MSQGRARPLTSCSTSLGQVRLLRFPTAHYVSVILRYAVFSALRTFALTKNWPLATLVFLLSMVPLGVNFVRPQCCSNMSLSSDLSLDVCVQAHFAFNSTGANFFTGCLTTDDVSSELAKQCVLSLFSFLSTSSSRADCRGSYPYADVCMPSYSNGTHMHADTVFY